MAVKTTRPCKDRRMHEDWRRRGKRRREIICRLNAGGCDLKTQVFTKKIETGVYLEEIREGSSPTWQESSPVAVAAS